MDCGFSFLEELDLTSRSSLVEKKFLQALKQLPNDLTKVVVGLSGGADSCVLLHLLARFKNLLPSSCALEAVYVHHGLSANADKWESFCSSYAQSLGISFASEHVNLELGPRISVEAEARSKRYAALTKHFKLGRSLLATAHHANDEAETFLLALKRGSGLPGLAAMGNLQDIAGGSIWRPLLKVARSDIEEYAHDFNLNFVTDESNVDETYDRNFLRHQVIPVLCNRFPAFLDMVGLSASYVSEAQEIVKEMADQDFVFCEADDNSLNITSLLKLSVSRRKNLIRFLFKKVAGFFPRREFVDAIFRDVIPAAKDASPCSYSEGYSAQRFKDRLYIVTNKDLEHDDVCNISLDQEFVVLGKTWILKKTTGAGFSIKPSLLDYKVAFSTELHPYDRNMGRSLKKLFGEYKIPVWERKATPVVKDGEGKILGLFPNHIEKTCYTKGEGYIFEEISKCDSF